MTAAIETVKAPARMIVAERDQLLTDRPAYADILQRSGLGRCDYCGRLARITGCLDKDCPNHNGTAATVSWPWGMPPCPK